MSWYKGQVLRTSTLPIGSPTSFRIGGVKSSFLEIPGVSGGEILGGGYFLKQYDGRPYTQKLHAMNIYHWPIIFTAYGKK